MTFFAVKVRVLNEKDSYKRLNKVILPKDYIRLKLTGEVFSDFTDASSTLLFNIRERKWATDISSSVGLDNSLFPQCRESFDISGYITKAAEIETGLQRLY